MSIPDILPNKKEKNRRHIFLIRLSQLCKDEQPNMHKTTSIRTLV